MDFSYLGSNPRIQKPFLTLRRELWVVGEEAIVDVSKLLPPRVDPGCAINGKKNFKKSLVDGLSGHLMGILYTVRADFGSL